MTEYNIFCYSEKYDDNNSFQQKRYRAFNKDVGERRYNEIKILINKILSKDIKLEDLWNTVTTKQWQELLSIPEAKDFKEGFEFISGVKIDLGDKVKVVCEGKEVFISRESAITLNLLESEG
jgi:hypothetical protein